MNQPTTSTGTASAGLAIGNRTGAAPPTRAPTSIVRPIPRRAVTRRTIGAPRTNPKLPRRKTAPIVPAEKCSTRASKSTRTTLRAAPTTLVAPTYTAVQRNRSWPATNRRPSAICLRMVGTSSGTGTTGSGRRMRFMERPATTKPRASTSRASGCRQGLDQQAGQAWPSQLGAGVTERQAGTGLVQAGGPYQGGQVRLPGDVVEGCHEAHEEGDHVQDLDIEVAERPQDGHGPEHPRPSQGRVQKRRAPPAPLQPDTYGQTEQEVRNGAQSRERPHFEGAGMQKDNGGKRQGQQAHLRPDAGGTFAQEHLEEVPVTHEAPGGRQWLGLRG